MEPVWLKRYPEGVPAEIDPDAYGSLVDLLEKCCAEHGDATAFVNMGSSVSFGELDEFTRDFAAWLQGRAGLGRGDRVGIMMPNLLQYPVVLFGALRAGLTVVNINPMYRERELERTLEDAAPKAVVVVETAGAVMAEALAKVAVEHVVITSIGEMLSFPRSLAVNFVVRHLRRMVPEFDIGHAVQLGECLQQGRELALEPPGVGGDDIAFLQYTGGTTGRPKAAMLTHRNMIANVEQTWSWFAPWIDASDEVIITALPLYHIFCLTCNCMTFLKFGATNVLITDPRDLDGFIKELGRWRFSTMTGVNTLFNHLLRHEEFRRLDFSALKFPVSGGMALQPSVASRWQEVTGVRIIEGYGLTEASPVICINPCDAPEHTGSIGLPVASTEVTLRDDREREVAPGEPGELWARGPQVMKGYWNRPGETRETLTGDGWLRTGDIATMDEEGFFRIVDRKKDMINVSGFNVYPNEVEEVAVMMDGIVEAACVGVPDEDTGEAVKLVVVAEQGANLTADAVRAHCDRYLTGYKVPHRVEFRDELPKSSVGKILRRELVEDEG